MARALENSRQRFIESGVAAGFSAEEMKRRANVMGLTPKLVETVFEAKGITKTDLLVRRLRNGYRDLPPSVVTSLKATGVDLTRGEIRDLKRQYDLTPKQVKTLVALKSAGAKLGISEIEALMAALDNKKATPKLDANPAPAKAKVDTATGWLAQYNGTTGTAKLNADASGVAGTVNWAQSMINRLTGKTVVVTTVHAQVNAKRNEMASHATGGYIQGPGTGTSDDIPAWLSNGEYVMPAATVSRYGLDLMEAMRAGTYAEREGFAKGGQAGKGKKRKVPMGLNSEFDLMPKKFIVAWERDNRAVEKQTKATELQTSKLQDLISSQDDLKSSIMEAYQSDLFEGTSDGWAQPSKGPMGQLNEDIANLGALGKAENRLDDVLKGDALAAVLKAPLADVQAMATWSNQQLAAYQAKFDQRTALAGGVSANAGQSAYGPLIAAQDRATRAAEVRQLKMEKQLGRFEQRIDSWPQKFADALGKTARNSKSKGK